MRIVLVEDEHKTRNGILNMIKQFTAHEVVGVGENGQEGYELVKEKQPDLIISDIRMPVMDGLEAAKTIRRMARRDAQSVPIIAMTANAFDEDTKKSIESGMNGHLAKPVDIQELLRAIQEVI